MNVGRRPARRPACRTAARRTACRLAGAIGASWRQSLEPQREVVVVLKSFSFFTAFFSLRFSEVSVECSDFFLLFPINR